VNALLIIEDEIAYHQIAVYVRNRRGNFRPGWRRWELQFLDAQFARRARIQVKIDMLHDEIVRLIAHDKIDIGQTAAVPLE